MKINPKTNCANCGKLFSPKDKKRALYCSSACKTAAYRKRKAVKEIIDNGDPNRPIKWETRAIKEEIRNSKYTALDALISNTKTKIQNLKGEEKRLKARKKELENSLNPTDAEKYYQPALSWGIGSLIVGFGTSMLFPPKAPQGQELPNKDLRFVGIAALVIIAVFVGILMTNSQRKDEAKELPEINKRLYEIPDEIKEAEQLIARLSAELATIPETIEREKSEQYPVLEPVELIDEVEQPI